MAPPPTSESSDTFELMHSKASEGDSVSIRRDTAAFPLVLNGMLGLSLTSLGYGRTLTAGARSEAMR